MKFSDTGKLANGQFSPDMLPDFLREHKFQIFVYCPNPKHSFPWPECDYTYINYENGRLDVMGKCPKCGQLSASSYTFDGDIK